MREEGRVNISRSLIGNKRAWKGDKAGYVAIHLWVKKYFGRKEKCERCGKKPPDVSRLELANISGQYRRVKSDWMTLCTSCHLKMDFRNRIKSCPQGHVYTPGNTRINKRGHRHCRICSNASSKKSRERRLQNA